MKRFLIIAIGLSFLQINCIAQRRLLCLSWNVESGENHKDTIGKRIADLEGYDIIGLTEVEADNANFYAESAEIGEGAGGSSNADFRYALGTTGAADRMMIIWDNKRLEQVGEAIELFDLSQGNHRAPLFSKFRVRGTDIEFIYMVNHLARGNTALRNSQAQGLSNWVSGQSLPVISVGDYNFDFSIDDGEGNEGYNNMIEGNHWSWLRPERLYQTQLSSSYYSVLDFVFIGNMPDSWRGTSSILLSNPPLDNDFESDHRPVEAHFYIQ